MNDRYIVTIRNINNGDVHDYEPLTLSRAMDVVDSYLEATSLGDLKITLERTIVIGEWTSGVRTT